ncbi:MAG TPA: DUF6660 family protein [Bacteroidia bacterium]|nr:DUF6660 family protein [Bacteroidia bacterium]
MKLFFCILFNLYILLLCSMPCTDICSDDKDSTQKSEITDKPANPHEDETCSPFCNCFCCGSIAVVVSLLTDIISTEFSLDKVVKPELIKIKNISSAVWQPPKTI